jgi:hypothetical protein
LSTPEKRQFDAGIAAKYNDRLRRFFEFRLPNPSDEAVLRFQKTLWQALSDFDNALSARIQLILGVSATSRSP